MQKDTIIHKFVDQALDELKELGLMKVSYSDIPYEMKVGNTSDPDGWTEWKPIPSTVSEQEISEVEIFAGKSFPESFKTFLRYKHFYELATPNPMDVVFFEHPIYTWQKKYFNYYSYDWVREFLLANHYIPFADHQDWGILCFNAVESVTDNEYSIILIDHDLVFDNPIPSVLFNNSFIEMISERLLYK